MAIETVYSFSDIALGLNRDLYLRSLGFKPYEWQTKILKDPSKRIIVNGSRQSGKSTIISAEACHAARFKNKALVIVEAPTQDQSSLDMEKILDFIAHDRHYPKIERQNDKEIRLANGSKIRLVITTDKASRGYSNPDMIILDEASRIPDIVYRSGVRPMLTSNAKCELILISTPFGKDGFFYRAWFNTSDNWSKYEVRSPWTVLDTDQHNLIKYEPSEEDMKGREKLRVNFSFSPRHYDFEEQAENLHEMGMQQYLQEYCCDFVETEHAAFAYADIDMMFSSPLEDEEPSLLPADDEEDELFLKPVGGEFF